MTASTILAALAIAAPAPGTAALVRDQARQLREQQARIEALERQVRALVADRAAAPPPAPAAPATPQVAAAPAATAVPAPVAVAQAAPPRRRIDVLRGLPAGDAALRPPSFPLTIPSPSASADQGDEVFDWHKGLPEITSRDGRYAFRLRGRALIDASSTSGSRYAGRNITGTEARSVRLGVEGKAGDHIAYQVEADFADGQAALRGTYLALTDTWDGRIWELSLANRLTDRSFDGASSSDSLPLLERSVAALATQPRKGSFGLGAMLRVYGKTWHAAIQADGNEASGNGSVSDSATYTVRAHWNPWRSQNAIVHLGAWAYRENFSKGVLSAPLSARLGGRFNDLVTAQATSIAMPDHGQAFGVEAGGTLDSFWTFGEYGQRDVYGRAAFGGRHVGVAAGSIAAGYYLTGEKAPYVARGGIWSKPRVLRPVVDGGAGAFEIAARCDRVRYDGPLGGDGWSATAGLNWYLLDWVRLSVDGIVWRTDNLAGPYTGGDSGRTIYTRAQVSF